MRFEFEAIGRINACVIRKSHSLPVAYSAYFRRAVGAGVPQRTKLRRVTQPMIAGHNEDHAVPE